MRFELKKLTSRAFLIYAAVNVFTYLFAHVAYLFANDTLGAFFEYVSYYLSRSVEFIAPPVIASVAYLVFRTYGKRDTVLFSIGVLSARVFYTLPFYYLIFIYNYAFDSVESIILSLIASIGTVIYTFGELIISLLIFSLVKKQVFIKSGRDPKLPTSLERVNVLDFLAEGNLPVLTFSVLRFAVGLIEEIVDTVIFLVEYRSDFTPEEIITILVNFVLLFILLVVSYVVAASVRNKLIVDDELES